MTNVQCEEIADHLAASAHLSDLSDRRARKHVESCLRCQAEVAQYRKLLKALRSLREELVSTPTGLVGDILVRLEEAGERRAVRSLVAGRRTAYLGGLAVATAAGAGAAVILATRRSRAKIRNAA